MPSPSPFCCLVNQKRGLLITNRSRNAALKFPFDALATSLWRLDVQVQQVRAYNELRVVLLKGERRIGLRGLSPPLHSRESTASLVFPGCFSCFGSNQGHPRPLEEGHLNHTLVRDDSFQKRRRLCLTEFVEMCVDENLHFFENIITSLHHFALRIWSFSPSSISAFCLIASNSSSLVAIPLHQPF